MTQANNTNTGVLSRLGIVGFDFDSYQPLFKKMGVNSYEFTAMLYAQIVSGWNWNSLGSATGNQTGNASQAVNSGGTTGTHPGELRNIGIRALPILQGVLDGLCAVFDVAIPQAEGLRAAS